MIDAAVHAARDIGGSERPCTRRSLIALYARS
jgi:hypothetical protein